jgi:hypothetical protein
MVVFRMGDGGSGVASLTDRQPDHETNRSEARQENTTT